MAPQRYTLRQDRKGAIWDALLYVPTVVILGLIGLKLWYGANHEWAYILFFLASFFLIVGANRILKTRLMLLPSAPVALITDTGRVRLELRSGEIVDLIKNLRYYADTQGKSFALTGMEVLGKRLQYIFHFGQFPSAGSYQEITSTLKMYQ